jgi:putative lumazine-binding protein/histidine kinase
MAMNVRVVMCGLVALGMTAGVAGVRQVSAAAADEAAVRQTAELYLQGHATGRGEFMRQAFHPDAKLFSVRDGKVSQVTLDEFVGRLKGKPADDEAKRKRRVASVDVTGTAAVAKIDLDYPDAHIVDYMSLLKVDGSWKIVNKSFHVDRKLGRPSREGGPVRRPRRARFVPGGVARGGGRRLARGRRAMIRSGRYTFWVVQLAGWGALALSHIVLSAPAMSGRPVSDWGGVVFYKVTKSAVGLVFSLGLYRLYRGMLERGASLVSLGLAAAALSFPVGAAWLVAVGLICHRVVNFDNFGRDTLNAGFVFVAWSALYFSFSYRRQLEVETERALRATAHAAEARLRMLQYQVNPHFLFNSLNAIRALVDENPAAAREMITRLADFFRYSLESGKASLVPLVDEVEAASNYLNIQKGRFEEGLDVSFDVAPEALGARVPGFLLQPLVENAVKYGLETSGPPLKVRVEARVSDEVLGIEVRNTGRWVEPSGPGPNGTGTGLENLRERLRFAFAGRGRLDVREDGDWVLARIELPLPEGAS